PLVKNGDTWSVVRRISPGIFQYKYVVDGEKYENDPYNHMLIDNYNRSGKNSVFVLTAAGEIVLSATSPGPRLNRDDVYPEPEGTKPVYLNIIWHQHQPLYLNPETDQLEGPWVRTHATKDYYDMAAMLQRYPKVHCNVNLTSSLLHQLREYYVNRLKPFVDTKRNRMDAKAFLKRWKGKTDPWIDLALKPTSEFDRKDKDYLYNNAWNAFGISEVMLERFPEYQALRDYMANLDQMPGFDIFSEEQMREIKFWFYLAYFDPDFLLGPVKLPDGSVCDLSDYVEFRSDGKFYLKKKITEADCHRMVVEAYKVMANVIPVHKSLMYDEARRNGQVEVITTPFYHPILPLIYDSDLARICQPEDRLPPRFSYPKDASAQVAKAVKMYREIFGAPPNGMWPGEGSVAQPVLRVLRDHGILWTASDAKVLQRSTPPRQPNTTAYQFPAPDSNRTMALVFRDTELSDRIGFKYQNYDGEEAAEDFVQSILTFAPREREDDVLITVILDGENAWEWYRKDIDGKEFLNSLYRKLSKLYDSRRIITVTTMEYLTGNAERGIPPHPIEELPMMTSLWPGSWINGNYDTWIGEAEENLAWEYLLRTRQDLERSGIKQPDPKASPPKKGTRAWYRYMAWEAMYAAEGSDWFWWYGADQTAPGGEGPFDRAFRNHLENVYKFAAKAGASIASPGFAPIISEGNAGRAGQGTMAQSSDERQLVVFTCDASAQKVSQAIFIAGNLPALADWTPNIVRMFDDGTHGDEHSNDGVWSLEVEVPVGTEIQYKYTNSGRKGEWVQGEEFPIRNRQLLIEQRLSSSRIIKDIFGN
ncbi:MAG: hypothetical protein HY708_01440, partial [Ignavibacteriae bacterium]|nr:hypothetical protein [Ignavibacteriota bacterium]